MSSYVRNSLFSLPLPSLSPFLSCFLRVLLRLSAFSFCGLDQYFEDCLLAEQEAQDRYYEELQRMQQQQAASGQGAAAGAAAAGSSPSAARGSPHTPEWSQILRGPSLSSTASSTVPSSSASSYSPATTIGGGDSISVRSAPLFGLHHHYHHHFHHHGGGGGGGGGGAILRKTPSPRMSSHKRAFSAIVVSPPSFSSTVSASASNPGIHYSPSPSQLSLSSSSHSPRRPRRPQSLYVPFQGCVEPPPAPPGRAARDILHALSYAPTSHSSQGSLSSCCSSSWASSSAGSVSPKFSSVLPCIPQSPPRKLRSKSSSLATLISVSPTSSSAGGVGGGRPLMELPLSYSTQELVRFNTSSPLSPGSGSTPTEERLKALRGETAAAAVQAPAAKEEEPVYSPTNPLNNSENHAISMVHPPIIHPPPVTRQQQQQQQRHQRSASNPVQQQQEQQQQQAPLGSIKEASPSG